MVLAGVRSELRGTETALAHANSLRNSHAMDFSRQISESISNNTTDKLGISASEAQNLQKALRVTIGHNNSDDYSQSSHTSAALSGGLEFGKGSESGLGVGVGANIQTNTDARNTHSYGANRQSQDEMSQQEASSIVMDCARSIAHSSSNSEVKHSAEKYLQSVEESDTLSARKSALEQELHSMTESFSRNRSLGMSTKMALHDDAREELVQSMEISHEEANRMINKNTPEARAAFEKVYDQKTQAIPNRPAAKQMGWTVGNSTDDLHNQYSAQRETIEQKMTESKSGMKFEVKNIPKVSAKIQEISKNMESGRENIQREKNNIVQKVDERAKNGTFVGTLKQIIGEKKAVSDEKK
jgi:hypothetical protein